MMDCVRWLRDSLPVFFALAFLAGSGTVYGDEGPQRIEDLIFETSSVQGGVVVHLGCKENELTVALHANDSLIVQGLDTNPECVAEARAEIARRSLGGKVTADPFDGQHLPYASNLVNLVVISNRFSVEKEEILRVLRPGGTAVSLVGLFDTFTKPWPSNIDEWTHYLHGPDNNAIANDTVVGPPQHFQWISGPRFGRSHDHLASVSAVVSAGGRLFSIVDKGSIAFAGASPRWRLVAQDAFNGVLLWEREISSWEYHLRDFRSGPADIARRLVAVGDRVFVTLGYGQPVTALDAATGETKRIYSGTEGTREILFDEDVLFLALGASKKDWHAQKAKEIVSQPGYRPPFEDFTPPAYDTKILAVDAETGSIAWSSTTPDARTLMPSTLATSADRVYFESEDAVVCLDKSTGDPRWRAPRPVHRPRLAWSTPTLVVHDNVVFSADRKAAETEGEMLWMPSGGYHDYLRGDVEGELIAYDAETGKRLWSSPAYEGFNSPVDVLIADDLVWTGRYAWGNDPGITAGRDPQTGEVRRQRPPDSEFLPRIGHARCHRARGTTDYLLLGRRGVEFIDLETGDMTANFWIRGECQFGFLPANGLLYIPPHACACSVTDMLKTGFIALAPEQDAKGEANRVKDDERPRTGPAYEDHRHASSPSSNTSNDWPMYRHDVGRSGATTAEVPFEKLQPAWSQQLHGGLTSPVVAEGMLLVAAMDKHCVQAFDVETHKPHWNFIASARIDSSPTIHQGKALFGSADGHVYCLRLADGETVWDFNAAPQNRRIVVNNELESPWPVSGSVLVSQDRVFFAAGRTSYLDGGMFLYKLDANSGKLLQVLELNVPKEKRDGGYAVGGQLPDLLSSDGQSLFLRRSRFDYELARQKDNVPHLWSSVGLLDDTWWHRTYWQIGTNMNSGWGGWAKAGQRVPAGRILATDGKRAFGYGRNQYDTPGAHVGIDADGVWGPIGREMGRWTYYRLFGRDLVQQKSPPGRKPAAPPVQPKGWNRQVPVLVQGLVLAGKTLFIAGPDDPLREVPHTPRGVDPLVEAIESVQGGKLLAISTEDGTTLAEWELDSPPLFDGMVAAGGRLYLSTKSGQVVCLSSAE